MQVWYGNRYRDRYVNSMSWICLDFCRLRLKLLYWIAAHSQVAIKVMPLNLATLCVGDRCTTAISNRPSRSLAYHVTARFFYWKNLAATWVIEIFFFFKKNQGL